MIEILYRIFQRPKHTEHNLRISSKDGHEKTLKTSGPSYGSNYLACISYITPKTTTTCTDPILSSQLSSLEPRSMEPHWWRYLILPPLLAVARPCRRHWGGKRPGPDVWEGDPAGHGCPFTDVVR